MKKYTISIPFGSSCDYTLTGGAASASFSPSTNFSTTITETECSGKAVTIPLSNKLHITKARLVSTGAPGVVSGEAIAASIDMMTSDSESNTCNFNVTLNQWNEWEEKDVFVDSLPAGGDDLLTVKSSSTLYIHDFNVQTDYIGVTLAPTLELEIEADFLTADDTNV
jgi:hypothetical protein